MWWTSLVALIQHGIQQQNHGRMNAKPRVKNRMHRTQVKFPLLYSKTVCTCNSQHMETSAIVSWIDNKSIQEHTLLCEESRYAPHYVCKVILSDYFAIPIAMQIIIYKSHGLQCQIKITTVNISIRLRHNIRLLDLLMSLALMYILLSTGTLVHMVVDLSRTKLDTYIMIACWAIAWYILLVYCCSWSYPISLAVSDCDRHISKHQW